MGFNEIPTRNNGDDILASWFNKIKTELLASSIDELVDVDTTTTPPALDEVLKWDGSNWIPGEGGGSGGGGLNFLSGDDSNCENTIGNWIEYDDGAVAAPVDGLGGTAANITLGRNVVTAEILRGTASFEIVKGAADAQGEGVSIPFSIDQFDQGKEIFVKLKYRNDANYASGDIKAYIYDVTNATLIGALRNDDDGDFISHTGQGTSYLGAFSAASDSISYRLIFHITSTNALAYDFRFDSVEISPDSVVPGAIITEMDNEYTATITGASVAGSITYTSNTLKWGRVGSGVHVQGNIRINTVSTAPTGAIYINLPPGLNTDPIKTNSDGGRGPWGTTSSKVAGAAIELNFITINAPTTNDIEMQDGTGAFGTLLAGDEIKVDFIVPIQGWSSGAMISTTENLFSTVTVRGESNGGEALTADVTNITFTETEDLTGSWDGQIFTAPRTQEYTIFGGVRFTVAGSRGISAYINGTISKLLQTNLSSTLVHISGQLKLNKGYQLSFRSDSAGTLSANANTHYIVIQGRPDLSRASVFGETELVETGSALSAVWPATVGQWGDVDSRVVPAGEFDLTMVYGWRHNSGTGIGTTDIFVGLSKDAGNSFTDKVLGKNAVQTTTQNTAFEMYEYSIPRYRVINSVPTTYYLKAQSGIVNANLLSYYWYVSARRIK